jgi:small subunit ribosomal protein S16
VADQEKARDGRIVATLGHYNPRATPAVIQVDAEQAREWLGKGALPSETVRSLLRKAGVLKGGAAGSAGAASSAPSPAGE